MSSPSCIILFVPHQVRPESDSTGSGQGVRSRTSAFVEYSHVSRPAVSKVRPRRRHHNPKLCISAANLYRSIDYAVCLSVITSRVKSRFQNTISSHNLDLQGQRNSPVMPHRIRKIRASPARQCRRRHTSFLRGILPPVRAESGGLRGARIPARVKSMDRMTLRSSAPIPPQSSHGAATLDFRKNCLHRT